MPLYLQSVLGLMVSGSTVGGEYNDIHYAPAALPCNVTSEPQLTLVTTCTHILLASLHSTAGVTAVTSLCTYIPLYVVMYLRMYAYMSLCILIINVFMTIQAYNKQSNINELLATQYGNK